MKRKWKMIEAWLSDIGGRVIAIEKLLCPRGSDPPACPGAARGVGQGGGDERSQVAGLIPAAEGGAWIPAENPPDDDCVVIVATTAGEVDAGYTAEGEWCWLAGATIGDEVTHWMDFPAPPDERA